MYTAGICQTTSSRYNFNYNHWIAITIGTALRLASKPW